MKFINGMCFLIVFTIGIYLGVNQQQPTDIASPSGFAMSGLAQTSELQEIAELRLLLLSEVEKNKRLDDRLTELEYDIAESEQYMRELSFAANSTYAQNVFRNEDDQLPITSIGLSQNQQPLIDANDDIEIRFFQDSFDHSLSTSFYENLHLSFVNSPILQNTSVENVECRGTSCLIELREPSVFQTDDERFDYEFSLAAQLSEAGFPATVNITSDVDGISRLISEYKY